MSTALFVQATFFNTDNKSTDNKLMTTAAVSHNQSSQDNIMVVNLQKELQKRLEEDAGVKTLYITMGGEPRFNRALFENKSMALFVGDSMSIHHFTDDYGRITRRLLILYPMTFSRREEIPKQQILKKVEKAANQPEDNCGIEVVDLVELQKKHVYLEGQAAACYSYNGEFVYMALSGRSSEQVLSIICAPENLNIPNEKRFVFTAVLPHRSKENGRVIGEDVIPYTSLVGWCGKGICAWGLEFLRFPSEKDQEAFYEHLENNYSKVINLDESELRAFCGNAREVAIAHGNGERRVLCISHQALNALRPFKRQMLEDWYGLGNILPFYADVLERRAGRSVGSLVSVPVIHGEVLPLPGELGVIEAAKVDIKDGGC
ncbi:amidinotransferase, putative [Trypanosoma equiperdum]|uniref:Amidinotransferase n=2 Tax=Trypanozoon TaxID=39700 RepID=Q581V1_TRYB2|nr:hypothetical protein, conserved [Trypanosoma brucei brucei TREU927]AAX79869.1 hypothetical protein, conserved [Trypanosoma brucei]AAZ10721.1 hypothetical protein, conserved [Trypanosoma brucei brucei TREU927]SCU66793.1 amidinotransferase, putative [Trypanosoma equiperdum]